MPCRLLVSAFVAIALTAPARADFFVVDLRDFGFQPNAVNANREFVGSREFTPGGGFTAFRWDGTNGFLNLGTLGGASSSANAINDTGWITGTSQFSTSSTANRAFLWRPGIGITDLGTLGGNNSSANAINRNGFVVGTSQTAGNTATRAFLWNITNASITNLGTLGGNNSVANGINAVGTVVGTSDVTGGSQPFVWTEAGGITSLGGLASPTAFGRAFGINDSGAIVGQSVRVDGSMGAFLWQPGSGFLDLGTFGGANSTAFAINNRGEVVGSAQNAAGENRAFLWDATNGLRDLNDLATNISGFTLTSATGLSNSGDVLAESTTFDGTTVYLVSENPNLLVPTNAIPTPAAWLLLGLALPGLRLFRRK